MDAPTNLISKWMDDRWGPTPESEPAQEKEKPAPKKKARTAVGKAIQKRKERITPARVARAEKSRYKGPRVHDPIGDDAPYSKPPDKRIVKPPNKVPFVKPPATKKNLLTGSSGGMASKGTSAAFKAKPQKKSAPMMKVHPPKPAKPRSSSPLKAKSASPLKARAPAKKKRGSGGW